MIPRKRALALSAVYFILGIAGFLLILLYVNAVAGKHEQRFYLLVDGAILLVFSIFLLDVMSNYRDKLLKSKPPLR